MVNRKHLLVNFIGLITPLSAAVFAVPIILENIGAEKFGILTIFWAVIGYSNIFEFGIGKALTHALAAEDNIEIKQNRNLKAAAGILILMSIISFMVLKILLPFLFIKFLNLHGEILTEVLQASKWITLGIPIIILGPALIGCMEAKHLFYSINIVRIPVGFALFAVPAFVSNISLNLSDLILSMLIIRVFAVALQSWQFSRAYSFRFLRTKINPKDMKSLLRFGGWMTVSSIIGPILIYIDRFILTRFHGTEITYLYTLPFEAIIRFTVIPTAVVGVLFPKLVSSKSSASDSWKILKDAYILNATIMISTASVFLVFGGSLFRVWLGPDINLTVIVDVAKILVVALAINSFGHISQAKIQSIGRADLTAKLHMLELIAFLVYMPPLIMSFDVYGAAYAWLIRVSISTLALSLIVKFR